MLRAVLVLLGGALVACASSTTPGNGTDAPLGDDAPVVDGPDPIDAPTDAPLRGFGEPCLDKGECQSNICIFVGTGGRCTDLCNAGECPADWGCFGVVDIIEPGTVTEVCVPVVDQLCSACTGDAECTQVGQDRCLTYPDGDRFCGRDCRTVACPTGFTCQDMSMGPNIVRQCVPNSGACDCGPTNMGMTEACTIMTPFSTTCAGTRTCQGATGWGQCAPPSTTDDPDGTYADANCDGIDGDVTRGIFVSVAGVDNAACGTSHTSPCATISYGIVRGASTGRPNVYVQAGTYNEVVRLVNGVNVWGGYSGSWQRNSYSTAGHVVTVTGGIDNGVGGDGEYLTVRAHDLIASVTIADLILVGPQASGTVGSSGRSSYVVHADSALLRLERVRIVAGNGADGTAGSHGADALIVDRQGYMDGGRGGDGREYNTACDTSGRGAGGGAGANSCSQSPSSRPMNAGGGGAGGQMDTSCGCCGICTGSGCDARAGDNGGNAAHYVGAFGERGFGGPAGTGACNAASDPHGNAGEVTNGVGGNRNGTVGSISNGYWYGNGGGSGTTGQNGGGGGGGGGAGGCDDGTDAYGAGGGGGGAGGCAAIGAGGGGGGGGGSFGIFATGTGTEVILTDIVVQRGNGGRGGDGGRGGRGQSAGLGNGPGNNPGAAPAGNGGNGAHGGHGGGGAGGNGGRSVGIVNTPGTTITPTNVNFTGGSAGGAGAAGASAPFAPAQDRDGDDGEGGLGGTLDQTRTCASATSC